MRRLLVKVSRGHVTTEEVNLVCLVCLVCLFEYDVLRRRNRTGRRRRGQNTSFRAHNLWVQVVMIMLTELIEERSLAIVERDNYTVALVPMG